MFNRRSTDKSDDSSVQLIDEEVEAVISEALDAVVAGDFDTANSRPARSLRRSLNRVIRNLNQQMQAIQRHIHSDLLCSTSPNLRRHKTHSSTESLMVMIEAIVSEWISSPRQTEDAETDRSGFCRRAILGYCLILV